MTTIKNLNVNKKAFGKNKIYKIVIKTTAVLLAAGLALGIYKIYTNESEKNQIETIVEYYGEDSEENEILDYMELSEEMYSLDLQKYITDSNLYEKHLISNELKSPEEIKKLIENFKKFDKSFSSIDVKKISEYIDTILNLKKQEQLTNKYIYNTGYSTANENITSATKKYTAEVFGISAPENIKFRYLTSNSSGEENITITNTIDKKYGTDEEEVYNLRDSFSSKEENMIRKGVRSMVNTNTSYDKNDNDNYEFNRTRNQYIKDALAKSAILEQEVEDKDLYDSKLASKLR